jgi:hypothetical protein
MTTERHEMKEGDKVEMQGQKFILQKALEICSCDGCDATSDMCDRSPCTQDTILKKVTP